MYGWSKCAFCTVPPLGEARHHRICAVRRPEPGPDI
jgi:hypothetical protein